MYNFDGYNIIIIQTARLGQLMILKLIAQEKISLFINQFLLKSIPSKIILIVCLYIIIYYSNFNKYFDCYSGFHHQGTRNCSDTQYSLLLNGTNRELRTVSFNLLNDTSEKGEGIPPNHCQLEGVFYKQS